MERRKLFSYMVIGAIVGASTALLNKDVRQYTKNTLVKAKDKTTHFIKYPSKSVGNIRTKLKKVNETMSEVTEQTINTLEKIEETLEVFVDQK